MKQPSLTRRIRLASAAGVVLAAVPAVALTGGAAPAEAAPSHFNTDPYTTGCSRSATTIGSKAFAGGTMIVKMSRSCATNWVEWRGGVQTTVKRGKDHKSGAWTRTETDTASFSYSMQSSAPGTTPYTGTLRIGSTTVTAYCTYGCTFSTSTTAPAPSSSLSKRVDAFVAKYNGKYVDFDRAYGAQCHDLAQAFNKEVVGGRFIATPYTGGAKDSWRTYDTAKYTRVAASSAARKGDLAVWGNGTYGHIAVVLADAGSTVRTLTQNPGATRIANLSKSGLLGYLRPRG